MGGIKIVLQSEIINKHSDQSFTGTIIESKESLDYIIFNSEWERKREVLHNSHT